MTEEQLTRHFPFFEKELIGELIEVADVKTFGAGQLIMRTGQNIRSSLLVIDGLVKIYREDDQGNEFFMYYIESGEACAISLVCSLGTETSGLMARSVTDTTLLSIPLFKVDEWMGKYKSWAQFAVNSYRQRFDELLQTIDHIAFRNMDERLLFYLKRHQEKLNTNVLQVSYTQIAQELNSSREVISRLMKKLAEKGVIKLQGSQVEFVDLAQAL